MNRQYIGARYVPKLDGEWNRNKAYEGLTVVTYNGASFTSKKAVPIGVEISNEEYWMLSGNYNAQVEAYRSETENVSNRIDGAKIFNVLFPPREYTGNALSNSGSTCTETFAEIIEYCEENNFNVIYFPEGVYNCELPNKKLDNLSFVGTTNTVIGNKWCTINSDYIEGEETSDTYCTRLSFENLTFTGNNGNIETGLEVYGENITLRNITSYGHSKYGVRIGSVGNISSAIVGYNLQNKVYNICCYNNSFGNFVYNGQSDSDLYDIRCYDTVDMRTSNYPSIKFGSKGSGCRVYGMHIWGLRKNGFVSDAFEVEIYGGHFEGSVNKIVLNAPAIIKGQVYDTGENPECVGVTFNNTIRNAHFDLVFRNVYLCYKIGGKDGGLNTFVGSHNTNVNGAHLFDVKPSNTDKAMYEQYNFYNSETPVIETVEVNESYENTQYGRVVRTPSDMFIVNTNGRNLARYVNANSSDNSYVSTVTGDGKCGLHATGATNCDLELLPKGTGKVIIGGTATDGTIAPNAYLEIKLSNGQLVKVPIEK